MILNYTHRLAFIHIPKCAGSSVKEQLRPLDETGRRFERAQSHPRYGTVHRAHLPLWLLRELYPEDFDALTQSAAFAVLRDPQARFASALAQRIEQFGRRDPFALSASELRREIEIVTTFLAENPDSPKREFCHFQRQISFVELEGTRLVTHLYRMDEIPRLMAEIGRRTGQSFGGEDRPRVNRKLDFHVGGVGGLKTPILAINDALRGVLPPALHAAAKDRLKRLLTRQGGKNPIWVDAMADAEVRAFVAEYYRDDAALLASVSARDDSERAGGPA